MDIYKQSLDEQLKERFERWNYLYTHGGSDPNWSDGCNMSLVRNHIINIKLQMKGVGELTETYYRETPPEVDRDYMARADEIRENAKKSLRTYMNHPDYLYLVDAIKLLNKRQIDETCISNVIWYAKGLEMYIEKDDLVSMRRHENPERYVDSFISCRKRVEVILGETKPIQVYVMVKDEKQLAGQLTIDDWLGTT